MIKENNNISLSDAYLNYIEYAKLHLKPTTVLGLERKIKLHILKYVGHINIYEFNENDYISWQKNIRDLGYSNAFNKGIQCIMKRFFDYLGVIYNINNIPRKVDNFKEFNKIDNTNKINVFEYRDFKKFIKVSKNDILYHTLFKFLYFTGVRKGELLALNWNDLNNRYININKTITKEFFNGKRLILEPKTKNSNRKIKLDLKLYFELKKLKKYYQKNYKDFNNNFYIFGGNKPIATTTLDRKKDYYCDLAGVKKIRIHDFRHSHATLLYKHKCNIKYIQKRLGHSNIDTTLGIYVHFDNEKKSTAILNFIRLIF